jgi:hypothetical protein
MSFIEFNQLKKMNTKSQVKMWNKKNENFNG